MIRMRVIDAHTGAVLVEQALVEPELVAAAATYAAEQALAYMRAGRTVLLLVNDPEGDLTEPDEWMPLVVVLEP